MSKLLENIPSFSHISTTFQPLLFTFESCVLIDNLSEASLFHNCERVDFPVDLLIPKLLIKRPVLGVSGTGTGIRAGTITKGDSRCQPRPCSGEL